MNVQEIPVVFDCQGAALVGMVHRPETVCARGLLAVVAGGPQYRAGVGRLQVQLARALAARGVPVMRFDHRGLGDSEGQYLGFQNVEADIGAAIRAFQQQVPGLKEVVLWGGCDAASAIMINAWKFPEVTGVALGSPFAHSRETGDAAAIQHHYRRRMLDKSFWLKVLRLQYNPLPAMQTLLRSLGSYLAGKLTVGAQSADTPTHDDPSQPFVSRMRHGLSRFKGDMLLLMSGRSLVSKEFDVLVAQDLGWQQALRSPRHCTRHDLPDADQTYSSIASRAEVIEVACAWMLDPRASLSNPAPAGSAGAAGGA